MTYLYWRDVLAIWHEVGLCQSVFDLLVHWQLMSIQGLAMTCHFAQTATHIEVVRQSDAMTRCDLKDLVLTVAVEGCPLDVSRRSGPIELHLLALMAHDKLTSLVLAWKAHYQASKLKLGTRRVNMRLKESRGSLVDLVLVNNNMSVSQRSFGLTLSL
jgi:hypothetical protein